VLDSWVAATGLGGAVLACVAAAVLLAGVVRGYSGFGFSALVVLAASLVIAPAQLVPVLLLLEIVASVHMLPRVWPALEWRPLGLLVLGAGLSTPLGIYLLATLPAEGTRLLMAGLIFAASLALWCGFTLRERRSPWLHLGTGIVAGAVNGAAGVGGLVVVVVLMSIRMTADATRAILVALLFATDVVGIAAAAGNGLVDGETLATAAVLVPPLFLGVALGGRLYLGATPDQFRRFVLIVLMVLSAAGMVRALW
jgi:uncharacterized membrane protein YfcA